MNPGLRYLLWKTAVGKLRQMRRRMRGVKGKLSAAALAFVFLVMLVPWAMAAFEGHAPAEHARAIEQAREFGPAGLLMYVLLIGVSAQGLYFHASEIDFLFPAPITRRQLVLYNILARLRVQLVSAPLITLFMMRFTHHWYAALVAVMLVLGFMQLTAQLSGLAVAAAGEWLSRKVRILGVVILAALVVGGVLASRTHLPASASAGDIARLVLHHPIVETLSAMTRPFVEVALAPTPARVAGWGALCAAILVVEFVLILGLDVSYGEASLALSRKVQRRLDRMHAGGGAMAASGPSKFRLSLPRPPRLGGFGPLLWRQGLEAVRNPASVLGVGVMAAIFIIMFIAVPGMSSGDQAGSVVKSAVMMIVFLTIMSSQQVTFDFRRDVDRMAVLKSLPLRPSAVAAGQLVVNTLVLSLWQIVGVVGVAIATGEVEPGLVLGIVLVAVPINWLVTALDNGLFLLFPYRLAVKDAGQMPFMGRLMMVTFVKMMLLALCGVLAAIPAAISWFLLGNSYVLSGLAAGLVIAVLCVPFTWLVGWAFAAFDVSADTPS